MTTILRKLNIAVAVTAGVLMLAGGQATASIPGVLSSGGAVELLASPPGSVLAQVLESNTKIRVFKEKQEHVLTANVVADIINPGTYTTAASIVGQGGVIGSGRKVDSYFVHVDPVGASTSILYSYTGSITFETEILGIIILDAQLNASDAQLGALGTLYPTGLLNRGLEMNNQDQFSFSADRKTVNFTLLRTAEVIDQIRIVTNPIPEPAFFQMGALAAMGGLGLLRLRRR